MITDDDVIETFSRIAVKRDWTNPDLAYELLDFRWSSAILDVEVAQRNGQRARLRIDLPSSGRLQPWLYAPPDDAADWVGQLFIWIDEEVHTGGLGLSRVRTREGDDEYVVVEPYGWRVADVERHQRLSSLAGPRGWHNDVRP